MIKSRARTYNIHEAKTNLSRLIEQAQRGDDVVIARAGVPVVRLVAVSLPTGERPLGTEAGRLVIADDFDARLPDSELETFEA